MIFDDGNDNYNIKYSRQEGKVRDLSGSRFPHFPQRRETSMPMDCDKSYVYIVIPRATTENTIQRNIFKNGVTKSE